jgi:translation initiation factor IF-3
LSEGNKCKLVIVFRGREIVHPETGQAMLDQVVKACLDTAAVEQKPLMEGRRMVMVIGPKAGVIRPANAPVPVAPSPVRFSGPEGGAKPEGMPAEAPVAPQPTPTPAPQKP